MSSSFFVLGFIVGVAAIMYYLQKQKEKAAAASIKGHKVYINFLILNKDEAVRSTVEEKMTAKMGTGFVRDRLAKKLSQVAASKVSDEKIGEKIADKMAQEMPLKMTEMGINASATKVFIKGSVHLVSVDMAKLIEKTAGAEKAKKFNDIFSHVGESIADRVLPVVCSKLQEKLPVIMRDKFAEKGIEMDVNVCSAKDEAAFFFSAINAGAVDVSQEEDVIVARSDVLVVLEIVTTVSDEWFRSLMRFNQTLGPRDPISSHLLFCIHAGARKLK